MPAHQHRISFQQALHEHRLPLIDRDLALQLESCHSLERSPANSPSPYSGLGGAGPGYCQFPSWGSCPWQLSECGHYLWPRLGGTCLQLQPMDPLTLDDQATYLYLCTHLHVCNAGQQPNVSHVWNLNALSFLPTLRLWIKYLKPILSIDLSRPVVHPGSHPDFSLQASWFSNRNQAIIYRLNQQFFGGVLLEQALTVWSQNCSKNSNLNTNCVYNPI